MAKAPDLFQFASARQPGPSSLNGKRVLVTRTREQAGQLSQLLAERGARPIELPTIQIIPPADWGPVDAAIDALDSFSWIVFTSVNGVRFFADRMSERGLIPSLPPTAQIVAIGPATAASLAERGFRANLVSTRSTSEGIVEDLRWFNLRRCEVLLLRARLARDVIPHELRALGALVTDVAIYDTVPTGNPAAIRQILAEDGLHAVALTSSSTARNLVGLLGEDPALQLREVIVASIGPITSHTARELGLMVHAEAAELTMPALVAALERYFATLIEK